MKEEMGKFFCPKCKSPVKIFLSGIGHDITLFRTREKNGIKKWIFKSYNHWKGDFSSEYQSIKDCWEETGGFSEKEIESLRNSEYPNKCEKCNTVINNFKSLLFQVEIINPEENNTLKMLEKEIQEEKIKSKMLEKDLQEEKIKSQLLEKEIQEEKNKNIILTEKINSIMNELKEIKSTVLEIKDKTNIP